MSIYIPNFCYLIISLGKLSEKKILSHAFNLSLTKTMIKQMYMAENITEIKLNIQTHSPANFTRFLIACPIYSPLSKQPQLLQAIMLDSGHHIRRTRYHIGGKFQNTVAIHCFSFEMLFSSCSFHLITFSSRCLVRDLAV